MVRRVRVVISCMAFAMTFLVGSRTEAQNELRVDSRVVDPGAAGIELGIHLTSDSAVAAFSFGVTFPTEELAITSLALDAFILDSFAGSAALVLIDLGAGPGAATIVANFDAPPGSTDGAIPPAAALRIVGATFDLLAAAAPCSPSIVSIAPVGIGTPDSVPVELVDPFGMVLPAPETISGTIAFVVPAASFPFETGTYVVGSSPATLALVRDSLAAGPVIIFSEALPAAADPEGIAVSPFGAIWLTGGSIDQIGAYDSTGTLVDFADVGPNPISIAIDGRGDIWVGHAGDSTLWKLSSDGCILIGDGGLVLPAGIPLAAAPSALAVDGAHNLWAMSDDGHLYKFAPDGTELLHLGLDGVLRDLVVDARHRLWITHDGNVELRASDGSLINAIPLGAGLAPHHIAVRGDNEPWVTETAVGGVYRILPGGIVELFFAVSSPTGIAVDGNDRILVAESETDSAIIVDPNATPPLPGAPPAVDLGFNPDFHGDAAGFQQANVISAGADFDMDGVSNRPEIISKFNPFSPDSVPSAPPVNNLTCKVAAGVGEVTLTWENQVVYSSLSIAADGVLQADIAGDATSFVVTEQMVGQHLYAITGAGLGGNLGPPARCRATVGAGAILSGFPLSLTHDDGTILPTDITFLPPNQSLQLGPGGSTIRSFVAGQNGRIYGLNANLQVITQFASPYSSPGGIAYAPWGNGGAGSVFVANNSSVPEITQLTTTGIMINSSPLSASNDVDLIGAPIRSLTAAGTSGDSGVVFASAPITCEIWPFAVSDYSLVADLQFEHPGATAGIGYGGQNGCQVIPGGTVSGLGEPPSQVTMALTVQNADGGYDIRFYNVQSSSASEVGEAIPLFAAGAFDNSFEGFSFSSDPELGGLPGEDTVVLIGASTQFLYALRAGETGALFLRGDANDDGAVIGLEDGIFLLTWAFLKGPDPPCLDAADANDDGLALGLLDAIYVLNFTFTGGPPPPLPGKDSCGPDLTPDGLGCGFYNGCE